MSKLAQQMSKQIQPGMKAAPKKAGTSTAPSNMKCGGMAKKTPVKGRK